MKGDKQSNAKLFCFSCRSSTVHPETDRNMTNAPSSPSPTHRRHLHPPQSAAQSTISKSSRRSRRLRSQRPYSPVYSNINYNDVTDRFVQSQSAQTDMAQTPQLQLAFAKTLQLLDTCTQLRLIEKLCVLTCSQSFCDCAAKKNYSNCLLIVSLPTADAFPVVAFSLPKITFFSAGETKAGKIGCTRRLACSLLIPPAMQNST